MIFHVKTESFVIAFVTAHLKGAKATGFWIGMKMLRGNRYSWIDNSEVTYTNWQRGEPNGGDNVSIYPSTKITEILLSM